METQANEARKAGFWVRFAATGIDALVILGLTDSFVTLGRMLTTYVPFELTAIVLALVYSAFLLGWKGQTLGKLICGLSVRRQGGEAIGYVAAFLREVIGKLTLAIILPVGLAWTLFRQIGAGKEKLFPFLALATVLLTLILLLIHYILKRRTWYEYLARTIVYQDDQSRQHARIALGLVLGAIVVAVGIKAVQHISTYRIYSDMLPYSLSETPYANRPPSTLTEISSLAPNADSVFVQWLDENGKSPVDYAVEVASRHQVAIFGESHFNRSHVLFLNDIIPALYHRAGVRCIGMEVCTRGDNENISRLIKAPDYDKELALRIGRNQPWRSWGAREYWDMLEVVWRLNKGLPEGHQKMRVIGLDRQWDGTSFALTIAGDDAAEGASWERLRIFRALMGLPDLLFRDELMAREVEKEIIEKGERAIVWVGYHHSFVGYKQPYGKKGRMAYILREKYGDKVFQVKLHSAEGSPKLVKTDYQGPEPMMADFLERIMKARGHAPVGFDVVSSPLADLRDSTSYYYYFQPRVGLGDVASGYVYLEPREAFQQSRWVDGFITPAMFARYRPLYEGRAGMKFRDAKEVNEYFIRELGKKH